MTSDAPDIAPTPAADHAFFGHPRGLAFLAFTEAWERFSFSGMQSLLVLYMVDQLLQPGHVETVLGFAALRQVLEGIYGPLAPQPLSSIVFGLYTSFIFLMPVFGGLLGDRVFGQHRMVVTGALLMSLGHFLMAFEPSFLLALLLLIVGVGCLKGNITTQVGGLYADGDRRRTDGFQIFSIGLNTGIIAAPLICGTLGELYGWHYGFGAAGIGMLIGTLIYLAGRRYLPADRRTAEPAAPPPALLPEDRRLVLVLFVVFSLTACFLVSAGQLGNVYSLWLKTEVDRSVGSTTIPVTWFQSLTPLVSVTMTPLVMRFWQSRAQRGSESALLTKMGQGLAMMVAAMLILAVIAGDGAHGVAWPWVLPVHVLNGVAYVFVYPVGLALFSRVAPPGTRAMFIGIYFITSFVASNFVGWLGAFYQTMAPQAFWLMQAAVAGAGTLLVLLVGRPLGRIVAAAPEH
jgi:POT family proton-dependent oligopeptide transporter